MKKSHNVDEKQAGAGRAGMTCYASLSSLGDFIMTKAKKALKVELPTFNPNELDTHFVSLFGNCGIETVLQAIVDACNKEIETLDYLCETSRMPFFPKDREAYGVIKRETLNTLEKLEALPSLQEYDDMIEFPDTMPKEA